MRHKGLRSATSTVVLVLALAACAPSPPTADTDTRTPTPSRTSHFSPTPTAVPSADVETVADTGPCEEAVPAYPGADATEVEQLGGATLAVPFDRGPMPHAAGETIVNDDGVPVAYRAADNDTISVVAARFCVGEVWLHWTNYVRRDGDALYVGDTLNLDAHTILSVGDQNGVVHDNSLPEGFAIPPQR